MPPINQAAIASAGIIAASVVVVAAIAIYESPEVRRVADDLRRRIAIALHSLGDGVEPEGRNPRFNRPEDAEGFVESRGSAIHEVDADEETRRRQREELMYWNAKRQEMKEKEKPSLSRQRSGSTFDDFMSEDKSAERGTFVFNTGADVHAANDAGVVRRRGVEGVRGLNASMIANPFADEYGMDWNEKQEDEEMLAPGHDETVSDIYDATPQLAKAKPAVPDVLFDFDAQHSSERATLEQEHPVLSPARSMTLDRELADDEYMTAGQEDRRDAYSSIQEWATASAAASSSSSSEFNMGSHNEGFYSPIPVSPNAPLSEPELVSQGALTPVDSVSVADSGEEIEHDAVSRISDYDVMSDDSEGIPTPNSWSEVGSVVSETEEAPRM